MTSASSAQLPQAAPANANSLAGAHAWFAQRGLTRPREGRWIGGVTAAFARRYDINPLVARVVAVAGVIVLTPLLYLPLWVLMPGEPKTVNV